MADVAVNRTATEPGFRQRIQSAFILATLLWCARWGKDRSLAAALLTVNPSYAAIRQVLSRIRFERLKAAFNATQFANDRRRGAHVSFALFEAALTRASPPLF